MVLVQSEWKCTLSAIEFVSVGKKLFFFLSHMWCTAHDAVHVVYITWCGSRGIQDVMLFTWNTSRDAVHVVYSTWCGSRGIQHVMRFMWYTARDVVHVVCSTWSGSRGIQHVMRFAWYTAHDAVRVVYSTIILHSLQFTAISRSAKNICTRGGTQKSSCGRLSKRGSNSPRRVLGLAVSVPIWT